MGITLILIGHDVQKGCCLMRAIVNKKYRIIKDVPAIKNLTLKKNETIKIISVTEDKINFLRTSNNIEYEVSANRLAEYIEREY